MGGSVVARGGLKGLSVLGLGIDGHGARHEELLEGIDSILHVRDILMQSLIPLFEVAYVFCCFAENL
jgi:hypothetical protein